MNNEINFGLRYVYFCFCKIVLFFVNLFLFIGGDGDFDLLCKKVLEVVRGVY